MLRKLVVRSGGVLKVVCNESQSHEAAVKSVNPVTIFRGDFEFSPDLRLKVKQHACVPHSNFFLEFRKLVLYA